MTRPDRLGRFGTVFASGQAVQRKKQPTQDCTTNGGIR